MAASPHQHQERIREPKIPKQLGVGSYGAVYEGLDLKSGRLVAIKKLPLTENGPYSEQYISNLTKEVSIMKKLHHPNVVQYVGAKRAEDELRIYMEYVAGGTIASHLMKYGAMPENVTALYLRDILSGIHYLHSQRIAHRDIKCQNLLLCSSGCVKVTDFGTSREMGENQLAATTAGSPLYMSPEVAKGESAYDPFLADIWTIGIATLQMVTGSPPFPQFAAKPLQYLMHIVKEGVVPELPQPPAISDECYSFLTMCIQRDPSKRCTVGELLLHPFVANVGEPSCEGHGSIPVYSPSHHSTSPQSTSSDKK